ncbi:MAG: hypothetical protein J3R72DRAFT_438719 [Linnemannia gamsii]|nr:MAG: hypothetical protein J3R72DRAFT_438719 [Linnemannia gamsii]
MATNRLLKIPELVSLIGQHLDQHDFTICIRVNKSWFDAFCPMLYHTIVVADFDIHTHAFETAHTAPAATATITVANQAASQPRAEDSSLPPPLPPSINEKERDEKELGYGGSRIHKYSRLIHSITVANIRSLTYLGEEAINLKHIAVLPEMVYSIRFQSIFQDNARRRNWICLWDQYCKGEVSIPIWAALIDRNPDLQSVQIDLNHCELGTEKIVYALSQAKQLEVVSLQGVTQIDTIELLLDHCPHILSLTTSDTDRSRTSFAGANQIFKDDVVGAPTKIRHLCISTLDSWPIHVFRRCPDLESLTIPYSVTPDVFVALAQEVTQLAQAKFFVLRSLSFVVHSRDYLTNVPVLINDMKGIITNLLNSCCVQLTSLTIKDSLHILSPIMDQLDPILWSRLEEFRYSHGDYFPSRPAPTPRLCDLLALCPNLRVFEVSHTLVGVPEFLKVRPICFHSLVSLKLIVSTDHTRTIPPPGNPQHPQAAPPAWLLTPITPQEAEMATMAQFELPPHLPTPAPPAWLPTPITPQEAEMATMAQFELPPQLPISPASMYSGGSSRNAFIKMVADQGKEVNQRIVEFTQLRSLQFGIKTEGSDIRYILFPPLEGQDECVRTFKEGLPKLVSLQVKGVSYD